MFRDCNGEISLKIQGTNKNKFTQRYRYTVRWSKCNRKLWNHVVTVHRPGIPSPCKVTYPQSENMNPFTLLPPTNEVWGLVIFLHLSVILFTGGYLYMPCSLQGVDIPACLAGLQTHTQGEVEGSGRGGLQVHTQGEVEGPGRGGGSYRPTPKGELRGLARGVSRPTPGGFSRPTPGGVSQHTLM